VTPSNNQAQTARLVVQYPEDALAATPELDTINSADAHTLDELFRERVRRSPDKMAYSQFDSDSQQWCSFTWAELAMLVERWQVALREAGLKKGDRR